MGGHSATGDQKPPLTASFSPHPTGYDYFVPYNVIGDVFDITKTGIMVSSVWSIWKAAPFEGLRPTLQKAFLSREALVIPHFTVSAITFIAVKGITGNVRQARDGHNAGVGGTAAGLLWGLARGNSFSRAVAISAMSGAGLWSAAWFAGNGGLGLLGDDNLWKMNQVEYDSYVESTFLKRKKLEDVDPLPGYHGAAGIPYVPASEYLRRAEELDKIYQEVLDKKPVGRMNIWPGVEEYEGQAIV